MNEEEDTKELEIVEENPLAKIYDQMSEIASVVVNNIADDRDKNDEMYDFMQSSIDIDGDKNPATRDAMAKAMELKMKGTDQMINLLRIKAKLINPNKPGFEVNINLGDYDKKKGGDTNEMIDIAEKFRNR